MIYRDFETFIKIKGDLSVDEQIHIKNEIKKYCDMYSMQTDEDGIGYYLESNQCGRGLGPGLKFYYTLGKYRECFSLFDYNSYFEHDINYHGGEMNLNGTRYRIAHAQTYKTPERMWDKSKLYMGDEHYEYFIRGMEENEDYISVVGHTATENRKIWVSPSGRTIRTDCGNGYKPYNCERALGAIRLNDMKEFYV